MCELCNLERKTKWYYEDDFIVICDCLTCRIPMVVLKKHTTEISSYEEAVISQKIHEIFGKIGAVPRLSNMNEEAVKNIKWANFEYRKELRKVKDHLHWHIRMTTHPGASLPDIGGVVDHKQDTITD